MNIGVLAFSGVDELDLFGVLSVLNKANTKLDQAFNLKVLGLNDWEKTSGGSIISTHPITKSEWDVLVLPGGSAALAASDSHAYDEFIKHQINAGTKIYTVCSGVLLLRRLGYLRGKVLACHANKKEHLKGFFCIYLTMHDFLTKSLLSSSFIYLPNESERTHRIE